MIVSINHLVNADNGRMDTFSPDFNFIVDFSQIVNILHFTVLIISCSSSSFQGRLMHFLQRVLFLFLLAVVVFVNPCRLDDFGEGTSPQFTANYELIEFFLALLEVA